MEGRRIRWTLFTRLKPLLTLMVGFFAALGVLSLAHVGLAQAQSPGVSLSALVAQVNTLTSKLNADETTIANQGNTITSQGDTINTLKSQQQSDEATIANQGNTISALQARTAPLSVSGTDLYFTGVNVHIVSGSGSTNDGTIDQYGNPVAGKSLSGLGNLIIGYNGGRYNGNVRTGSHNLILGDQNNYGSFGGMIAGTQNAISGPFASVSGGNGLIQNTVNGWAAGSQGTTPYSGKFTSP